MLVEKVFPRQATMTAAEAVAYPHWMPQPTTPSARAAHTARWATTISGWTLTLASVSNEMDAGVSTAHGTLTATMVEQDADASTAGLSVAF